MQRSNFSSIVKAVSQNTGLPQSKVKEILIALFHKTTAAISDGQRVMFRGFGSFFKKQRKAKKYRDFRSGELMESATVTCPVFQPSKTFLREMNFTGKSRPKRRKRIQDEENPDAVHHNVVTQWTNKDGFEGCEIIISTPNPHQTDDLKIGYTPFNGYDSHIIYPIVQTPAPNSRLKLPRDGRSDVRGYKEKEFFAKLMDSLDNVSISDNCHLKIPGRYTPYEPDIVLYDESINLYIDVEIDEPYDGYSRLATHFIEGKDSVRNLFFKESGWVVVRFSEKQVHLSPEFCILFLKSLIDSMRGENTAPYPLIERENQWTRHQAISWEKEFYREKYLGIQHFPNPIRTRKIVCQDGPEGIDALIERTAALTSESVRPYQQFENSKPVVPNSIAARIPVALDFNEKTHTYYTAGDLTGNSDRISVTTLIENFFPSFDEEAYIQKRIEETGMSEEDVRRELAEPSNRGTDMHKQIEYFLKGIPYDGTSKEFQLFLRFYEDQIVRRGLLFDSAEYAIELKGSNIAGTIDALFRKANGEYVMVDWKRSKHLIIDGYPKKYGYGRGLSVISHLDNSSYFHYELQQSFYKYILEKDYGIKVSSMVLAVLHPDYDQYYAIKLSEYRKREVLDMIEAYEQSL